MRRQLLGVLEREVGSFAGLVVEERGGRGREDEVRCRFLLAIESLVEKGREATRRDDVIGREGG
jgi:hypothetical protein